MLTEKAMTIFSRSTVGDVVWEQPATKQSKAYVDSKAESKEKNRKIYFKTDLKRIKID